MPNMLDYNPTVDALQQLGRVGPAIAQGQYRGTELGLQRQQMMLDYYLRQQQAQQSLMALQQRLQQQKEMENYRQQQLGMGQQRLDEMRHRENEQKNEFALRFHENLMKAHQASRGKWKIDANSGLMFNDTTGEVKPISGAGFPQLGAAGVRGQQATAAELGHLLQAIPQVQAMGTNAPPTVMPALTNMLGRVQGNIMGTPGTNAPPQRAQFRFDPATGSFTPNQ